MKSAGGKVIFTQIVGSHGDQEYARWHSVGHGTGRPAFTIQRFTFKTDPRTGRTVEAEPYYRAYHNGRILDYHGKSMWDKFEDACTACDRRAFSHDG